MKITIIGSGHGVPEAHKKCTAILFEVGGSCYFVDAGCDIAYELANLRIHPDKVKGIFITHPHNDHMNGLYPFMTLLSWYYTDANPEVYVPHENGATLVHQYLGAFGSALRSEQKLAVYTEGVIFDDGNFKVTAFATKHCPNSHAFLIEAEGKRILCSGDLRRPSVDFPPVDDLDVAILEAAHFNVTEYADVLKTKTVKSVYINHYGNYIGIINGANFVTLQKELAPVPAELATDGMEIML